MTGLSKRKREVCDLLTEHAQSLKDDPERLSTSFLLGLIKSVSQEDYNQLIIDEKLVNLFALTDKFSRQSRRGNNQRRPNWLEANSLGDLFGLIDYGVETALANIAKRFRLADYWLKGRSYKIIIVDSRPYARSFTRSEIRRMNPATYKHYRNDILKAMSAGLIIDDL
ncbi:Uncharacterised protein [uncultured archaeon]|nr:Uncharacterised protein [uncultured archaeon]